MEARFVLAAIAATCVSVAAADTCLKDTGGTCRFLWCDTSRGATECSGGKCLCKPGYCAYDGGCAAPSRCDINTPGTCSLLSCSKKRGAVDCVDGKCVCKPGACAFDGKCVAGCESDTGGSCRLFGCSSSRNAVCEGHSCVCKPGHCALDGKCVKSQEIAMLMAGNRTYMSSKPEINSLEDLLDRLPQEAVIGAAASAGVALSASLFLLMGRRRLPPASTEPLIPNEAAS